MMMMMMMKDEEVSRLQAAFTAPVSEPWSSGACPEPDRIWEAVRGELPPEEVRDIVDHVAVCASCAEDWRIAKAFEEEAREKEAVVYSFPPRRIQPWFTAVAAALVMTVSGVYVWHAQKPVAPPEYRGEETAIEALVPPDAALPRESFILAWKPVPGAESYELLVTNELDTVVYPKDLTTTKYQVPADALANLPAATQLHWIVTAVFPDGRREPSPTFTATLE